MRRRGAFTVPDLAGVVFLLVLFAAFAPVIRFALDAAFPHLDTTGQLVAGLFLPMLLLAIIAQVWPDRR